jgi:hypothetical protein
VGKINLRKRVVRMCAHMLKKNTHLAGQLSSLLAARVTFDRLAAGVYAKGPEFVQRGERSRVRGQSKHTARGFIFLYTQCG